MTLQLKLRVYLQQQLDHGHSHTEINLCEQHAQELRPMPAAGRINVPMIQSVVTGAIPVPPEPVTQTVSLNVCSPLFCWACQWKEFA